MSGAPRPRADRASAGVPTPGYATSGIGRRSGAGAGGRAPRGFEPLDVDDRLAFERLLQWLRLSFLASPVLVAAAFGTGAAPFALLIAAATLGSFAVVEWPLRRAPRTLLAWQLRLRVLDCGLVFVVLFNYHAFLRDAYYDSTYLLFVCAAAATHGRRGALVLAPVAGGAVVACRLLHLHLGYFAFHVRHLTDPVYYTIFFFVTGLAVAHLMERSARAAQRRQDEFVSAASHDLKNPLTVILGTIEALERGLRTGRFDAERAAARLGRITHAARRMLTQLEELAAAAHGGSAPGRARPRAPTDLVELVRRAAAAHAGTAGTAGRRAIRVEVGADSIVGGWDPVGLGRVIDNLLSNAVKYSPAADIAVRVSRENGAAVLKVSDRGIGIPEAEQRRVFDRFFRGSNVGDTPGTGLGLAASRQIVEELGGTLTLTSREGEGTEFTVALPLDDQGARPRSPTPAS